MPRSAQDFEDDYELVEVTHKGVRIPNPETMSLAVGSAAVIAQSISVSQIYLQRMALEKYAIMYHKVGAWGMKPWQIAKAKAYDALGPKLAAAQAATFALPAVGLAPNLALTMDKDAGYARQWIRSYMLGTSERERANQRIRTSHSAIKHDRADSKVIRLVSTLGSVGLGVAVAFLSGGLGTVKFFYTFAKLIGAAQPGMQGVAAASSATYFGTAGQKGVGNLERKWNKFRTMLSPKHFYKLDPIDKVHLCERLSISSRGPKWWLSLRLALATGDTKRAKAWVVVTPGTGHTPTIESGGLTAENGYIPGDNGEYYRIDRKTNTYRGAKEVGFVAGAVVGFLLLNIPGLIIGAYIGYQAGKAIGGIFSYYQKPSAEMLNPETNPGGLDAVLYERIEYMKYKLYRHNIFSHLGKTYFRDAYRNAKGHAALKVLKAAVGGVFGMLFDTVKLIVTYPRTVYLNGKKLVPQIKASFLAIPKAFKFAWKRVVTEPWNKSKQERAALNGTAKTKATAKLAAKIVAGIIFAPVAIPLALAAGAVMVAFLPVMLLFKLLNPFSQTSYVKKQEQLENAKKSLEQQQELLDQISELEEFNAAFTPGEAAGDNLVQADINGLRETAGTTYRTCIQGFNCERAERAGLDVKLPVVQGAQQPAPAAGKLKQCAADFEAAAQNAYGQVMDFFGTHKSQEKQAEKVAKYNDDITNAGLDADAQCPTITARAGQS